MARLSLCLALLLLAIPVSAVTLQPGTEGVDIDAGGMGKFTLIYPQLTDGAQKELHKLVEKQNGTKSVQLKYEGGGKITLTLAEQGTVQVKVEQLPADVKSIDWTMHIPIAFNQGGSWKMAGKDAAFPREKPAQPHLVQGHGKTLQLFNFEQRSLNIETPDHAFLQLTDNREWNWSIFHWRCHVPVDAMQNNATFVIKEVAPAAGTKTVALVDRFGQSTRIDWPSKLASEEELKADVARENEWYASLRPPKLDKFGGLPGSRAKLGLKATGFFHMEKKADRWFLVNPEGNVFFHLGACVMNPGDDYTLVTGREKSYEWIPEPSGKFASVFRSGQPGTVMSYHLANMIRKYDEPYTIETYTTRMIHRLRAWGFNSVGAFSYGGEKARAAASFPTVSALPISAWENVPRIPGIHEVYDPFDEKTRATIVANLEQHLPAHENDPLIIGWFIVNEPIYEQIPRVVPSLKGSEHACKRRLVQWLEEKYKNIAAYNKAWEAEAGSFNDLLEPGLSIKSAAATQDAEEFATFFLDEYFTLVEKPFRKLAPNHLLIGSRLQPATIAHKWICRTMGKYLDVVSYNYYTNGVDKAALKKFYEWSGEKPMMLSEFFWSSPKDSGLEGGREVNSQKERGLAYRNYVEQSASLGFVVGIEWFTLVDQSVTGRWFSGFDGERANTGLLSVTDRPWKETLVEMMKTNYTIYEVLLGERQPFAFEDTRFQNTAP